MSKKTEKKVSRIKAALKKPLRARSSTAKEVKAEKVAKALAEKNQPPKVKFGENYRTSQIYSMGFEFAFFTLIKGVWEQACTFVYCKDFLHDAVWAMINKKAWSIYGFKYNPAKDLPLDLNHCTMAFRNTQYKGKEEEFHAKLESCREFLNGVEKKLGFAPSQVHRVEHEGGPCWLIIGDKAWQHAPPLVGFYTLFIRLGFFHEAGRSVEETLELAKTGKIKLPGNSSYAGHRDASYIKQAWSGLQVLFKHRLGVFHSKMEENYPPDLPQTAGSLHDNLGPVAFSNKTPKSAMPRWYEEKYWA